MSTPCNDNVRALPKATLSRHNCKCKTKQSEKEDKSLQNDPISLAKRIFHNGQIHESTAAFYIFPPQIIL